MRFDEAVKGLRSEEIAALQSLEACGWQIGLDVRVEDMTKPDGQRRRTFSNRGRYAVAVFLKNLSGRDRVESPAFTPELNQGIAASQFVTSVGLVDPLTADIPGGGDHTTEANPVEAVEIKSDPFVPPGDAETKKEPKPDKKPVIKKGGRR